MKATHAGAGLALVAALAVGAASIRGDAPQAPAVVPCTRAILVDGVLLCDEAAPRDLARLCGPNAALPPAVGALLLSHGDAVVRAELCATTAPAPGGPGWARIGGEDLAALGIPVDINRASLAELESLPGIGPALAQAIVEGRPYASIDALLRVPGIGPARLAAIRPRARVDGAGDRSQGPGRKSHD